MSENKFERTLEDIAETIVDCEHKSAPIQDQGVPLIRTTDIKNGRLSLDSANRVSEKTFRVWCSRIEPRADDIILAREAPVGEVGIVPRNERICLGQRTTLIRIDKAKADPLYILYLLCTSKMKHEMTARAAGSVVPHLNVQDIRILPIPKLPALGEQKEIAKMIATLDDKIELIRQTNETLEVMAEAMFKQWFIDFEFPNEEGKPYKSSGGEMVDSELGTIPIDWKVGDIGEIAENPRHGVLPSEIEHDTPYIGLEHMPRRSIALSEWGDAIDTVSNKFHFLQGEFLFGKLRPYFHKVGVAPVDGVCSTDILVITPKLPEWYGIVLEHISSGDFVKYTDATSTGTKMPRTNWEDIAHYRIAIPTSSLAKAFNEIVVPLTQKVVVNILQTREVAEIRDSLLPKLMSGKIRVSVEVR